MKSIDSPTLKAIVACALLGAAPVHLRAGEPDAAAAEKAAASGDFAAYLNDATEWLRKKGANGAVTEASLMALLKDPVFANILDQRQLIFKTGADKLGAFAKADPANGKFLLALMKDTAAMDLYLEGCVPIGLAAREQNGYTLSTAPLETWRKILEADPDAKEGLYQRIAIATAMAPPGTGAPGAGQAKTQSDPLERYKHFKTAHKNKELFPSFDHLTVWELTKVVQSGASNEDLAWGRQMINSWRPDLRANELVVNSTSEVWRRNSPIDFAGTFKNVLAGGGKCGPRSSWSVFICQAFGIPAIGVGQPAHACVAYKTAFPMAEPQPGSAWKVGYGRGWQFSKLEGMGGLDFLAAVQDREHAVEFSQVEHLRWFASALPSPDPAGAVMEVAHKIQKSLTVVKTDATASLKPEEAEKELTPEAKAARVSADATKGPIPVKPGVTQIEAVSFSGMLAARVLDCMTGGKQVNFDKSIDDSWVEYHLDVADAGNYELVIKVAAANVDQVFNVKAGAGEPVNIKIPHTTGLWGMTPAVEIKLDKGPQTLRVSAPFQRGVALRNLELKSKN
jgi:hypothetical protein